MLFNEPKLLKSAVKVKEGDYLRGRFSALQRAEIAEIRIAIQIVQAARCFSALQRAEIAEKKTR